MYTLDSLTKPQVRFMAHIHAGATPSDDPTHGKIPEEFPAQSPQELPSEPPPEMPPSGPSHPPAKPEGYRVLD
jgi:hypothetical protein